MSIVDVNLEELRDFNVKNNEKIIVGRFLNYDVFTVYLVLLVGMSPDLIESCSKYAIDRKRRVKREKNTDTN